MSVRCREGHESTELDYCSVCGVAMTAASVAPAPAPAGASGSASACPSCGEPRTEADARFCEVCRYDFVAKHAGRPVVRPSVSAAVPAATAPIPSPSAPPRAPRAAKAAAKWQLVVMVDATLDTDPDEAAPCPKNRPIETVPIESDELLVGRRDDRRDIRPDLALDDPGTSRRHCKFVTGHGGSLSLQDLASTNGSRLNGEAVVAGSTSPLKDGDEVMIGRWTRIKVRGAT